MKKILHFLTAALIAFSSLTFTQETKSEPITAVIVGALWTYAVPSSLAAATGYIAWDKVREYFKDEQVKQGFKEAADDRAQIKKEVGVVGKGLENLTKKTDENQREVLSNIEFSRKEFRRQLDESRKEYKEEIRGIQSLIEQGLSKEDVVAVVKEAEERSQERFKSLGSEFACLQNILAEDRSRFSRGQEEVTEQLKNLQRHLQESEATAETYRKEQIQQTEQLHIKLDEVKTLLSRIQRQGCVSLPPQSQLESSRLRITSSRSGKSSPCSLEIGLS